MVHDRMHSPAWLGGQELHRVTSSFDQLGAGDVADTAALFTRRKAQSDEQMGFAGSRVCDRHDRLAGVHVLPGGQLPQQCWGDGGYGVNDALRQPFQPGELGIVDAPSAAPSGAVVDPGAQDLAEVAHGRWMRSFVTDHVSVDQRARRARWLLTLKGTLRSRQPHENHRSFILDRKIADGDVVRECVGLAAMDEAGSGRLTHPVSRIRTGP